MTSPLPYASPSWESVIRQAGEFRLCVLVTGSLADPDALAVALDAYAETGRLRLPERLYLTPHIAPQAATGSLRTGYPTDFRRAIVTFDRCVRKRRLMHAWRWGWSAVPHILEPAGNAHSGWTRGVVSTAGGTTRQHVVRRHPSLLAGHYDARVAGRSLRALAERDALGLLLREVGG